MIVPYRLNGMTVPAAPQPLAASAPGACGMSLPQFDAVFGDSVPFDDVTAEVRAGGSDGAMPTAEPLDSDVHAAPSIDARESGIRS